jgi:Mn2+/Fe2+ NRAMP family transporter
LKGKLNYSHIFFIWSSSFQQWSLIKTVLKTETNSKKKEKEREMAAESKISLLGLSYAVVLMILLITSKAGAVPLYSNTSGGETEQLKESDQTCPEPLVFNQATYISYRAFGRAAICNAKIYGNCIIRSRSRERPCSYYTRCNR